MVTFTDADAEMGSQSVAGTQRHTALLADEQYTRYSNQGHPPGISDDSEDERSEAEEDDSQDRENAEMRETALDSLWHTSEGLSTLLRIPRPQKKSWKSLLAIQRQNWGNIQKLFTDKPDLLIDLTKVVEDIPREHQSKARVIIAGANATALQDVLSAAQRDDDPLEILERLDRDFPAPFLLYAGDDPEEILTEEHVQLALDIRTQRLIATLRRLPDESVTPADVAAELFCSSKAPIHAEETLLHGPYKGIGPWKTERFGERAQAIHDLIEYKTVAEAIHDLSENFVLEGANDGSDLVTRISRWCFDLVDRVREVLREPAQLRQRSPTDSLASSTPREIVRRDVYLSAANRRAQSRSSGPQQRVPWSDKDTSRLIRLIEYHNCVWARIAKRQFPAGRVGDPGPEDTEDCVFDHPRDQQAIRDKARNLKVDMLKADLPLYPNFDNIILGKKERQALISRGKNPDRLEEDVDFKGRPIRTEYVPMEDE
ncbi:hypothetical protein CCHL11_00569 [Colletotrichum chlorophyti]|uniref:Myb-like domain-containing protein n=1 Tax=Colletotrichum chlorophyti TaxID=708187 RepID=A0A1Q8S4T8_9PEZI|nr:hypothetical protein CCHL11_00569 [Colletotrichum chlorophyti]